MKRFTKAQLPAMTTEEIIEADVEFRDAIAATTVEVVRNNLHQHRTPLCNTLYFRAGAGDLAAKRYYYGEES